MSIIDQEHNLDHSRSLFHFTIKGDPIPLARARFGRHGVWDAQKKLKHEYRECIENQFGMREFYDGPLHVEMVFYFGMPDSWSYKKQSKMHGIHHSFKPDLSNLVKFLEDVCTGIIYKDDCVIASLSAMKKYDYQPRVECFIREIKHESN